MDNIILLKLSNEIGTLRTNNIILESQNEELVNKVKSLELLLAEFQKDVDDLK